MLSSVCAAMDGRLSHRSLRGAHGLVGCERVWQDAASPAEEYRRLYEQVCNKQAGAEKERKAYDEEIKKLKALRKELDRAIGEV